MTLIDNRIFTWIVLSLFINSCVNKAIDSKEGGSKMEESILAEIRKDGWLFENENGCNQSTELSSDWKVTGVYIAKDSLIDLYIRKSYEYTTNPRHKGSIDYEKLKVIYADIYDRIIYRIEELHYDKFGLLYYEGRYQCENGIKEQKDTVPIMLNEKSKKREFVEIGLVTGP